MMSDFEYEMQRLLELDTAVRMYLSHLWAVEQGVEEDAGVIDRLRDELGRLTEDR
jgi:hypothetical protein